MSAVLLGVGAAEALAVLSAPNIPGAAQEAAEHIRAQARAGRIDWSPEECTEVAG